MSKATELSAVNLKSELWKALQGVKSGKITPATGDVIATQAREILRTIKTQLHIFAQSSEDVSEEVKVFARGKSK